MQTNLLKYLDNCDYGLKPQGAWVRFPSKEYAELVTQIFFNDLTATAQKLGGVVDISWGSNCKNTFQVYGWMNESQEEAMTTPTNNLWFAQLAVSPGLLRLAADLMDNPRKAGIVRISDERQVIMHDETKILCPDHSLSEATNWKRSQFWHPQDLVDFRQHCLQELTPGGEKNIEFTWRSFDPDIGMKDSRPGNWLEFTTKYQLFDGGDGEFYQVCENVDMREIQMPPV